MGRKFMGDRSGTLPPRGDSALKRTDVTSGCNDCNEALACAHEVIGNARRLALFVVSALLNGDPHGARKVLDQLQSVLASKDERAASQGLSQRRPR
jgi:hypothetical protein